MRVIFHIPICLNPDDPSASQIRPRRMVDTFRSLGYEVDVVQGYGAQRRRQIAAIRKKIKKGIHYDFLYSESSTMPTLLTERHHLPLFPTLDFSFFAFCRRHSIRVGLFYRDIHWQFINRNADWKQRVARHFYFFDLYAYRRWVDVLFLPSLEMLAHIPFTFPRTVLSLPSGCGTTPVQVQPHDGLTIFYVGGVSGNYDLRPLLEAVARVDGVRLTLCCRSDDWELVRSHYQPYLTPRVDVVHASSEQLPPLYAAADLFAILFAPSPYMQFAVPMKFYEAVGFGLPLLASADTWVGNEVERRTLGFAVQPTADAVEHQLRHLLHNPEVVAACRTAVARYAADNTWEARCTTVAKALTHK